MRWSYYAEVSAVPSRPFAPSLAEALVFVVPAFLPRVSDRCIVSSLSVCGRVPLVRDEGHERQVGACVVSVVVAQESPNSQFLRSCPFRDGNHESKGGLVHVQLRLLQRGAEQLDLLALRAATELVSVRD